MSNTSEVRTHLLLLDLVSVSELWGLRLFRNVHMDVEFPHGWNSELFGYFQWHIPEQNISTTTGHISVRLNVDERTYFNDPLTFPLAPPSSQIHLDQSVLLWENNCSDFHRIWTNCNIGSWPCNPMCSELRKIPPTRHNEMGTDFPSHHFDHTWL